MEYQATAKYIRMSPRKVRLVTDSIKTLSPQAALGFLSRMPKRAATPLADVITSALANAKQKQVGENKLRIKGMEVMGGPAMKRWHAISRGSAHAFKKRMTHIRVTLTDEEGDK